MQSLADVDDEASVDGGLGFPRSILSDGARDKAEARQAAAQKKAPSKSKKAAASAFPTNHVHTSHYNAVNFVPKSIFNQFRRLANQYL